MPDPYTPVLSVGRRGSTGLFGPQGPAWGPDAPYDTIAYGRAPWGAWVPVLPLTGRSLNNAAGTMSGGISFGQMIASSANDLSRHINLGGGGVNITGGSLNYLGSNMAWSFAGNVSGGITVIGYPAIAHIGSNALNAFIFQPILGQLSWTGINATWGIYAVNEVLVGGVGIRPAGTGPTNGISWRWDGTWFWARVDQVYEYPVANACDERMKQDIAPCNFDTLDILRKVRLYQYRWVDHAKKSRRRAMPLIPIGFVAQRLAEDFPDGAVIRREKSRGATSLGTADRNTMLAALCRAVQQLEARLQALRETRHA